MYNALQHSEFLEPCTTFDFKSKKVLQDFILSTFTVYIDLGSIQYRWLFVATKSNLRTNKRNFKTNFNLSEIDSSAPIKALNSM